MLYDAHDALRLCSDIARRGDDLAAAVVTGAIALHAIEILVEVTQSLHATTLHVVLAEGNLTRTQNQLREPHISHPKMLASLPCCVVTIS